MISVWKIFCDQHVNIFCDQLVEIIGSQGAFSRSQMGLERGTQKHIDTYRVMVDADG